MRDALFYKMSKWTRKCEMISIYEIDQGSQTQIITRATLAIKNVLRATHYRKNGFAATVLGRGLLRAHFLSNMTISLFALL